MSTAAAVDIGSMIYKMKTATGERACLVGTATSVKMIAKWLNAGEAPEDIQANYPHLSLEQVNAAVAYYHANREEIDQAIERDRAAGQKLAAKGRVA